MKELNDKCNFLLLFRLFIPTENFVYSQFYCFLVISPYPYKYELLLKWEFRGTEYWYRILNTATAL